MRELGNCNSNDTFHTLNRKGYFTTVWTITLQDSTCENNPLMASVTPHPTQQYVIVHILHWSTLQTIQFVRTNDIALTKRVLFDKVLRLNALTFIRFTLNPL